MVAIRGARVFDGAEFLDGGGTVLVRDGRIVGVESGFPDLGAEWEIIDFPDATVLPGLVDTHVHLVADSQQNALDRVAGFTEEEIDEVVTDGLRSSLAAGVTTVRDLGDRLFNVVARRDRQRRTPGLLEPTIVASGPPLTSPGGHCYYMGGEIPDRATLEAAISARVDRGVDIIKVMASGGMSTAGTDITGTQFSVEDLQELVDRAHAAGLPVAAHAQSLASVEAALAARVDAIEHCSCMTETGPVVTDDLIERLAASGVVVGGVFGVRPVISLEQAPVNVRAFAERTGATIESMVARRREIMNRMYRGGVRFVTGADSGLADWRAHGQLSTSVEQFVAAGADVVTALAASTSLAADTCGVGERKGRLRAGHDADVLVVDGDLSGDVGRLADVRSVMLGGVLVTAA